LLSSSFISLSKPAEKDEELQSHDEINYDAYHISEITDNNYIKKIEFESPIPITPKTEKRTITEQQNQPLSSGLMNSSWPMFCHDVRHTGRSPYNPVEYPIEKWRHNIEYGGYGSPAIYEDGTIFVGGWYFHAIYPNGTLKWTSENFIDVDSCPVIDEEGIIYIGDANGGDSLYAFYPNGEIKWIREYGQIFSSPVIGEDGTIYFGRRCGDEGAIIAVYPNNGSQKWAFNTGHVVYSSPAIGDDGTIYCGSHDQNLYALYPNNGTEKWHFRSGHWIRTSPCIGDDGIVYCVSLDSNLYGLYPENGTIKIEVNVGAGTSPTIGPDGTIYCGFADLYAINPNGTIKWIFDPGSDRRIRGGTPCTDANGTIYFGTSIDPYYGGEIIAVNPNGTERWRKLLSNDYAEAAPCIASDGTIYIVSIHWYDDRQRAVYLHSFGTVEDNTPPEIEEFYGPTYGEINRWYWYWMSASDPDNNPISYCIDWGDGNNEWTMDYEQNVSIRVGHRWDYQGIYEVKVKARDSIGAESDWSEPIIVNMTTEINTEFKNRFLFVSIFICNDGDYDLHNVEWELSIFPADFFGKIKFPKGKITGSSEILRSHDNLLIRSRVRGFGNFDANLLYKADEMSSTHRSVANGLILGPFILFFIKDY